MYGFYQEGFKLPDPYETDFFLRATLEWRLSPNHWPDVDQDLRDFSQRVRHEIEPLGLAAEAQPPRLNNFDVWGRRTEEIIVSEAWKKLESISAEEGLVAAGYERAFGADSRVAQFAKLYLFHPSSAVYSCPLAMTDGAARLIEVHGDDFLKNEIFPHLVSRDPEFFWTSGQWMTERSGGSDISRSETKAKKIQGTFCLYGDKWFTSSPTSQVAMTLARIVNDADDSTVEGSRGLSLFFVAPCHEYRYYKSYRVNRLKDKLGTKALPTAELSLEFIKSRLIGDPGRGVALISTLFNITRIYNAVCASSSLRRLLQLAADYAGRRKAFGHKLNQLPLHLETLAEWEVKCAAITALTFEVATLLGQVECGAGRAEAALLRLFTPIAKLFTAKLAVKGVSELIESFGGAGYVENTGLPRYLRDSQVLTIWEGTTNVLSLDLLRAIEKDEVLPHFEIWLEQLLLKGKGVIGLQKAYVTCLDARDELLRQFQHMQHVDDESRQTAARALAFNIARLSSAALLLAQTAWILGLDGTKNQARANRLLHICNRWCASPLVTPLPFHHGPDNKTILSL